MKVIYESLLLLAHSLHEYIGGANTDTCDGGFGSGTASGCEAIADVP